MTQHFPPDNIIKLKRGGGEYIFIEPCKYNTICRGKLNHTFKYRFILCIDGCMSLNEIIILGFIILKLI